MEKMFLLWLDGRDISLISKFRFDSNAAMLALFFSLVSVLSFGLGLWLQIDSFLETNPSWVFVVPIVIPLFCTCLHVLIFYLVG
jgi:hypothetical protein